MAEKYNLFVNKLFMVEQCWIFLRILLSLHITYNIFDFLLVNSWQPWFLTSDYLSLAFSMSILFKPIPSLDNIMILMLSVVICAKKKYAGKKTTFNFWITLSSSNSIDQIIKTCLCKCSPIIWEVLIDAPQLYTPQSLL